MPTPDAPTDEQLVEAFRRGETGAYRTLVERYHDDLIRFLTRLVGDRTGAEDLFQETFLQVYQSADTFDVSRRFRPWLFTIAANKGRDHLRRKGRRKTVELSAPVGGGGSGGERNASFVDLMEVDVPAPGEGLDRSERDRMVQEALQELQPALREILLLAYFQRLSYARIAEDLGIPLGTVKSRLHAAVAAFARQWQIKTRDMRDE
ncbi:MAG: sigma-70 family RNA polymerase sigma factor [Phycisphaerales bacterium]